MNSPMKYFKQTSNLVGTSTAKVFFFCSMVTVFGSIGMTVHGREVKMSRQDFEDAMVQVSNWGRWGKDDQKGTLNYITPETRLKAAQLVQEGVAVSLARMAHGRTISGRISDEWSLASTAAGCGRGVRRSNAGE